MHAHQKKEFRNRHWSTCVETKDNHETQISELRKENGYITRGMMPGRQKTNMASPTIALSYCPERVFRPWNKGKLGRVQWELRRWSWIWRKGKGQRTQDIVLGGRKLQIENCRWSYLVFVLFGFLWGRRFRMRRELL